MLRSCRRNTTFPCASTSSVPNPPTVLPPALPSCRIRFPIADCASATCSPFRADDTSGLSGRVLRPPGNGMPLLLALPIPSSNGRKPRSPMSSAIRAVFVNAPVPRSARCSSRAARGVVAFSRAARNVEVAPLPIPPTPAAHVNGSVSIRNISHVAEPPGAFTNSVSCHHCATASPPVTSGMSSPSASQPCS